MEALPPTFLVCGIQKGGTTALHDYLSSHPDVFCPERKELGFFDAGWDQGLDWYVDQFQGSAGFKAVGESSPHYMRFPEAAKRIAVHAPDARLIFVIRNPVARAWSNYTYNLARGLQDPAVSFHGAIDSDDGYERYIDKGFYARDLQRFAEICGPERMLVLFGESLRADPGPSLEAAFRFIGVDPESWRPRELTSNATSVPRSSRVLDLMYRWGRWRERLRPLVPAFLARRTRALRLRARRGLLSHAGRQLAMGDHDREVLEHLYESSNADLARWLMGSGIQVGPLPTWITRHLPEPTPASGPEGRGCLPGEAPQPSDSRACAS